MKGGGTNVLAAPTAIPTPTRAQKMILPHRCAGSGYLTQGFSISPLSFVDGQARLANKVLPLDTGLLYCVAEVYADPGRDDSRCCIDGLDGPVFGEGVPEREELERREGSDSLFEWDDENRTDDCRGEERVVVRIGDEGGMVPLLGRDLDLGGD
jgi:hypothetical protein